MSIVKDLADALDATELPWIEDGWMPLQPPQDSAYIVVSDSQEIESDDVHELFLVTHHYTISLYDYGNAQAALRTAVRDTLMASCLELNGMRCTGYSKETKLYETVYTVNELLEKVRVA